MLLRRVDCSIGVNGLLLCYFWFSCSDIAEECCWITFSRKQFSQLSECCCSGASIGKRYKSARSKSWNTIYRFRWMISLSHCGAVWKRHIFSFQRGFFQLDAQWSNENIIIILNKLWNLIGFRSLLTLLGETWNAIQFSIRDQLLRMFIWKPTIC